MNAVLEIIKKHLFSLICLLVAAAAVVLLFYPISGYYTDAQSQLEQRKVVYNKIMGIIQKPRSGPVTDPENPVQEKLTVFPSQAVQARGAKVVEQMNQASLSMLDAAVKLNVHKPLVEGSLPEATSTTPFTFRDRYRDMMDPSLPKQILLKEMLKAGCPPTEGEIRQAKDDLKKQKYLPRRVLLGNGMPEPTIEEALNKEYEAEAAELPDKMRLEVAKSCVVYALPEAVSMDMNCSRPDAAPTSEQIWHAQVGLWLQQDIVSAIREINSGCSSVLDAPIKRVTRVMLGDGPVGGEGIGRLKPDPNADSGPIPRNPAISTTGRTSNAFYDVHHVGMTLVVDAASIPKVIQLLQRGRLITVLDAQLISMDSVQETLKGYIYGPQPVVELNLRLEVLYMRKWTEPLMPLSIKR